MRMCVCVCVYVCACLCVCAQVEAERDLVAGRAARDAQDESKLASMRAALRTLEAEVRLAHQETAAAKMRYGTHIHTHTHKPFMVGHGRWQQGVCVCVRVCVCVCVYTGLRWLRS